MVATETVRTKFTTFGRTGNNNTCHNCHKDKTSQDRPKSAPYLRLKIEKGLQRIKYSLLHPLLQNIKNIEGGFFGDIKKFSQKVSQYRKIERGPFGVFQHPFCRKTAKKIEGGL